ncbi:nuclease (SNase domain-containing protein) [Thermodesulfobacterium geofontis OPF15]|uniref:Nuclease (SNase domain-containing protein) n=1 Tax=Thermodesulfobacterium geofontis (strain OPF15) TaxID=795359 RepID=F8C445_THEGP|nr:thermonuclease family protein [Thermodesulfobacterium geofontis]AEH23705.1 nuclease (SNase domain-containing protein) [Thermodesulfobacterium geofontis OPF15]
MKLKKLFSILLIFFIFITLSCQKSAQTLKKDHLLKVRVVKAIDGDTVILENGERLRYAGIDTTEIHTQEGIPQPFALSAYNLNKTLTEGKTFYLELALRKRDKYGRLLGELYFENGTSVSEILVREGLAFVCYYEGSAKYYEKYLPLQREAIKKRKGIFSLLNREPKNIIYIGNKNSKRFHHPDCPEAKKIKRKVYFKSIESALLEGYCPSRECFNLIFSF